MQRRRSCQNFYSIHVYVVPTAVCTPVLYTIILTVQLSFLPDRLEHRIHPGDTRHHTPHRVKCWARVPRLKIISFHLSPECGIAQLILPLFVSFSKSAAWRRETAMPTLTCQSSPDSNQLQCLHSCQHTCSIPVCTVCAAYTHVLYTLSDCKWIKQL